MRKVLAIAPVLKIKLYVLRIRTVTKFFIEPEGRDIPELYIQGFSTGLPEAPAIGDVAIAPRDGILYHAAASLCSGI